MRIINPDFLSCCWVSPDVGDGLVGARQVVQACHYEMTSEAWRSLQNLLEFLQSSFLQCRGLAFTVFIGRLFLGFIESSKSLVESAFVVWLKEDLEKSDVARLHQGRVHEGSGSFHARTISAKHDGVLVEGEKQDVTIKPKAPHGRENRCKFCGQSLIPHISVAGLEAVEVVEEVSAIFSHSVCRGLAGIERDKRVEGVESVSRTPRPAGWSHRKASEQIRPITALITHLFLLRVVRLLPPASRLV